MKFLKYLLLLLFVMTSYAQTTTISTYEYSLGKPFKKDNVGFRYVEHETGSLGIKLDGTYIGIRKLGPNSLSSTYFEEFKLKEILSKNFTIENLCLVDDYACMFYSLPEPKSKNDRLFLKRISIQSGRFDEGGDKELIEVEGKTDSEYRKFHVLTGKYKGSGKNDKIAITYKKESKSRKSSKSFGSYGICVLDGALNEMWKQEYIMPYSDRELVVYGKLVDKDGNVFFLIKKYKNGKRNERLKKTDDHPNYQFEIFKFLKDGSVKQVEVDFDNRFVDRISFFNGNNGDIMISGTFTNASNVNLQESVFVWRFSESLEEPFKMEYKLPSDLASNYRNWAQRMEVEAIRSSGEEGYLGLKFKSIRELDDGSMIIILEELGLKASSNMNSNKFYNQSLVVLHVTWNGVLNWVKKIPKNYYVKGGNVNKSSYSSFVQENKFCFVYLGRKEDVNVGPEKFVKYGGKDVLLTAIDLKSGKMNTEALFSLKDKKIKLKDINYNSIVELSGTSFALDFETNNEFIQVLFMKKK